MIKTVFPGTIVERNDKEKSAFVFSSTIYLLQSEKRQFFVIKKKEKSRFTWFVRVFLTIIAKCRRVAAVLWNRLNLLQTSEYNNQNDENHWVRVNIIIKPSTCRNTMILIKAGNLQYLHYFFLITRDTCCSKAFPK